MNTQETTLRRDASDVEEAALDEESAATRGSLEHLQSLEDSDREDFSQSKAVCFAEQALEQGGRDQTWDKNKECLGIFWRSQDRSCYD